MVARRNRSPATVCWCYHRPVGLSFVLGVGIITPFPAMANEDWTVVPPAPWLAPESDAEDARGQTSTVYQVPHNEINRPLPRNATWANNIPLTNAQKTALIEEYQHERRGDPRGLTASGLALFIKGKGVKMQSKQGILRSHFLRGTPFTMSYDGLMIRPPADQ